jgi:hypothetical protein
LGLALNNCNDSIGMLPPLVGRFPQKTGNRNTLHFWLLPFIEQGTLYKSAVTPTGTYDPFTYPIGNEAASFAVKSYICPSDPSIDSAGHAIGIGGGLLPSGKAPTATDYAANGQVFATNFNATTFLPGSNEGYARIPTTFQDGLSNTIVFAEKYRRCGANNRGSLWARNNPPNSTYGPYFNVRKAEPLYSFQLQPVPYDNNNTCDYTLASTAHTGGILVGLGDGSARLVNHGVSTATWWAACTPAGGEPLGSDW